MTRIGLAAVVAACAWMAGLAALQAADTWPTSGTPMRAESFNQVPVEVALRMATREGQTTVQSQQAIFEQGTLYRLTISNDSNTTHTFWTRDLGGYGAEMRVADLRGGTSRLRVGGAPGEEYMAPEITIPPGGVAVLEFVPVVEGDYVVGCGISEHIDAETIMLHVIPAIGEVG